MILQGISGERNHRSEWATPSSMLPNLRWAKTRVVKTDARVETRVSKTLACRKDVEGFFKHW